MKHLDLVKFLIDECANQNIPDINNVTCLHTAVDNGNIKIIKLLLNSNKCVLNIADKNVSNFFYTGYLYL